MELGLTIPKNQDPKAKRADRGTRTNNYGLIVQATREFITTEWTTAPALAKVLTQKMKKSIVAPAVRSNLNRLVAEGELRSKKVDGVTYYSRLVCLR